MLRKIIFLIVFVIFSADKLVVGWHHYASPPENYSYERKVEHSKLSNDTEYCYHFTWMGESFNNRTFKNIRNKTCSQYFKDKKTLCINPMTATYKGNPPDIDYILKNHANEATCRLSQGRVCVKYTVTSNGLTSYQTRYCSIVNVDAEGPMRKGCITEKRGNDVIEVCVCKSEPGPEGICNSAFRSSDTHSLISVLMTLVTYYLFLRR